MISVKFTFEDDHIANGEFDDYDDFADYIREYFQDMRKVKLMEVLLENNGKIYYGWRELQETTGVTKHLYNKYYLNGIDPEKRIGANGPAKGTP